MDRKYVLGLLVALVLSNLVNFIPILPTPRSVNISSPA